mmetsp:Transcript_44999/g.109349  ORF Transcript_44999/g.109349 Transcript_44999/m.109349 type:complete len:87 (+) Transcript_44999:233-493(+)
MVFVFFFVDSTHKIAIVSLQLTRQAQHTTKQPSASVHPSSIDQNNDRYMQRKMHNNFWVKASHSTSVSHNVLKLHPVLPSKNEEEE